MARCSPYCDQLPPLAVRYLFGFRVHRLDVLVVRLSTVIEPTTGSVETGDRHLLS
jgi:hypothetical protein